MPIVAKPRPPFCSGLSVQFDFLVVGRAADDDRDAILHVAERHAALELQERRIHAVADLDDLVARLAARPATPANRAPFPKRSHGMYFTPMPYAITAKMNAKITFMITPAEMIAIRCGTLLAR